MDKYPKCMDYYTILVFFNITEGKIDYLCKNHKTTIQIYEQNITRPLPSLNAFVV